MGRYSGRFGGRALGSGLLKLAVCSLPFIAAFTLSVLSAKLENINKRVYLLIMLGVLTFLSLIPLVSELNTRAPAHISLTEHSHIGNWQTV